MITEPVAPLALIRRHHRFDSCPELVRNHTHPRHRAILAGQDVNIRETRPRLLFPVQRQAVHQRPRVRSSASSPRTASPSRHSTTASQLSRTRRRCRPSATTRSRADRRAAAQVAARSCRTRLRPADRPAGYRYDISILQAEFSLTQVLDRPLTGRVFFEQVIREQPRHRPARPGAADLRPARDAPRQRDPGPVPHPGDHRRRDPRLHVDYKHTRIKQYHKEGRRLRTETTINDTTRLLDRQTADQSARPARGRLPSQPTSAATSNDSATTRSPAPTRSTPSPPRSPPPPAPGCPDCGWPSGAATPCFRRC